MSKTLPSLQTSFWALLRRLLGGMGLGLSISTSPALAQTTPLPVPQHWISYAQQVSQEFQERLGDSGNQAALRLHAWMQERSLAQPASAPLPSLVLCLWVAPTGKVLRLEFDSLGQQQADEDLLQLLTAGALLNSPPPDMRQPMVLQLTLDLLASS